MHLCRYVDLKTRAVFSLFPATFALVPFLMHRIVDFILFVPYSYTTKQSDDDAKGGKEFVLMAGFPPKDLISDIDNSIESCQLAGEAITVRWK